ncbi:hypothetical protein [Enterobacter hormaechei]|uniref:hypothetical protein n=1 Tax=Enterobacter hormaechei TaxID=158836 RepID=UPI0022F0E89B|nr:hypothetical protein [Enterobacter hormaechei]MDA4840379.1 hypothetical protein [Enterobacter hormaechei]
MITLTKEWLLKTIAELEEERDAVPGAVNEDAANALAAMKLAMASLEAEPVAYIFKHPAGRLFWSLTDESNKGQSDVMPVYTAQPAPVFVPDELTREEYKRRFMEDDDFDDTFRGGWKAHRAAMLQGAEKSETPTTMQTAPALDSSPKIAESPTGINQDKSEPVTTAYKLPFEQWLSQQTGTIDVECGCVMTEVFFHWLRVAYEAGNSPHCREILNS